MSDLPKPRSRQDYYQNYLAGYGNFADLLPPNPDRSSNLDYYLYEQCINRDAYVNRNVINADIGLRKWRTAMADIRAGSNKIYNLNFIGNSFTEGYLITDKVNNTFPGRVRTALATKYGDVGKGIIPAYISSIINSPQLWNTTGFMEFVIGKFGICGHSLQTTTIGSTASVIISGTEVHLLVMKGTFASATAINCKVDGVDKGTFALNNATTIIADLTIATGLTDGSHTLLITTLDTSAVMIIGAYGTKGTKGIRVNNMGRSGARSFDAQESSRILEAEFTTMKPTLSIIELGLNDAQIPVPLATYKTQMQNLVTSALAQGDCLLLAPTMYTNDLPYRDVQRQLAIDNNCAFIDIASRWGESMPTLFKASDLAHPNEIGDCDIASAILRVIDEY